MPGDKEVFLENEGGSVTTETGSQPEGAQGRELEEREQ